MISVQAWQPWAASRGTRSAWLCCIKAKAPAIQCAFAAPALAAANSTPVPRGRLSSNTSPACNGPLRNRCWLGAWPLRLKASSNCWLRGLFSFGGSKSCRLWPPNSSAPNGSSTLLMPARLCSSRFSCRAASQRGSWINTWALWSWAPLAQRSEQACKAVSRALSQGSATRAGKPSMLCSHCTPAMGSPIAAASSTSRGCPNRCSALLKGWAANFAAQPLQAISLRGRPCCIAAVCCCSIAIKRLSRCCFRSQLQRFGPQCNGPHSP